MSTPDYLTHIGRDSRRFAACLATADPTAAVPSCPDWTAADLLWHLAEVQAFWGTVIRERLTDPEAAEAWAPTRPAGYPELVQVYERASQELLQALADTSDDVTVWTWAEEQSVRFLRRRQAHEALIHRLDAELTIKDVTDFDPALATDGADEALRIMYGNYPGWADFTPGHDWIRISATDTGTSWDTTIGSFSGTSPNTGTSYDHEPVLQVADGPGSGSPVVTVRGTARDLDAWLWNRPPLTEIDVSGDEDLYRRFLVVVHQGVQ